MMGARHDRIDFVRLVEQAQDMAELEEALAEAVQTAAPPADVASILDFLEIPASGAFDVAPEQAIGYFKAKGLKATFSYADMLDYQHDQAFTVAKMMDIDMLGQVRASLDSAMANGTAFKEWTKEITPILQSGGWWGRKQVVDPLTGQEIVAQLGSPWRLETIFRTNMQTAYAAGAWQEIVDQKDLAPLLMYDAVDDFRTRPLHASWDRKVVAVDSAWWQTHYPPNGYNCFLPMTPISGAIVAASKARYSGEAVEIETERGARLSVTPNHPIATVHGWVAAGQLREGDHVLSDSREIELVGASRAPDIAGGAVADQQRPASAEDLFNALAAHGRRSVQVAPLDFHGDAAGFDGEIDVVLVGNHKLVRDDLPTRTQGGGEPALSGRDADLATEPRAGELAELDVGLGATAGGDVCGVYLARSGALAHVAPLRALRIGLAAQHYPEAGEASGDGITAYTEFARELVDRGSGHVAPDKIVRIRRFPFSGHVFDVQTLSGALSAGGIVAHNCRCGVIQLSHNEARAMGLKETVDPPDDGTYTWNNPRTGEKVEIPNGLDPGFAHNSGKLLQMKNHLAKLAQEKAQALTSDMEAAAKKAAADAEAKKIIEDMTSAATQAQQKAAAAAGKAALERAKAMANEKAAQWAAQQQLDAILKGKETAGAGAAYKIKALAEAKKVPGWDDLKPTEQLDQVLTSAAELKAKADLSKGLSAYKKAILEGKNPPPAAVKAFKSLDQADADAWIAKVDAEKAAIAKAAADAAAKAAAETSQAAPAVAGKAPDPGSLTQIGGQGGSNPGGLSQDAGTGLKWYVKWPPDAEMIRNEVLAAKLYELGGVDVPEVHIIQFNGRTAIASRFVDGLAKAAPAELAAAAGTAEGFAFDAWLANWDVAGLSFDNLLMKGGKAYRIDVGGSLRYKATGSLKPGASFGGTVGELESMKNAGINPQAAAVFSKIDPGKFDQGVKRLLALDEAQIRAVVEAYGPSNAAARSKLADTLIARRADIAKRFTNLSAPSAEALKAAMEEAAQQVIYARGLLDESILTAVKGIASRAAKGGALEAKDIERAAAAIKRLDELRKAASAVMLPSARDDLLAFYQPWIADLQAAVAPGAGTPARWGGSIFKGHAGAIEIDAKLVKVPPARAPGEVTPPGEANKIIADAFGSSVASMQVPQGPGAPLLTARMHMEHQRVISAYTGSHYRALNQALRTASAGAAQKRVEKLLNEALSLGPAYKGKVYRGLTLSGVERASFIAQHKMALANGSSLGHAQFNSTSRASGSSFGGNIRLVIDSKTGVHVKPISLHPGEDEVLFRSDAKFKVTKIDEGSSLVTIYLEEV